MSGLNPLAIFAVTQIQAEFCDTVGNHKPILGTGFFMVSEAGTSIFVTNRHNVDPSLKLNSAYALRSFSILLRRKEHDDFTAETRFVKVDLEDTLRLDHANADVSAFVAPKFIDQPIDFSWYQIAMKGNLANQEFLEKKVFQMDQLVFLGYPGSNNSHWWDSRWNISVARNASLACWLNVPFTNPNIPTTDVTLVSGLSFSGSSGSPVFLREKGIAPGDIIDPMYAPYTVLGIMSGHWKEQDQETEMFKHSGMSYYTRSTAIWDLLASVP